MSGKRCVAVAGIWMLASLAGCSPPPPSPTETDLAVEMPNEKGGGTVTDPIDPPDLTDVKAAPQEPAEGTALLQDVGSQDVGTQDVGTQDPASQHVVSQNAPSQDLGDGTSESVSASETGDAQQGEAAAASGGADSEVPLPGTDGALDQWRQWPQPIAALVVTGQQHGYIEPCGCTGLDRQKGGIARRFTLLKELRDKGWPLVPIDGGNQVRRFGRQAEVKLQQSVKALKMMDYRVVGFGPDDLRLGVGELLSVAAGENADETMFASANVVLIDPSLVPQFKMVSVNGLKLGVTSVLDPAALESQPSDDITIGNKEEFAQKALQSIRDAQANFSVLMFFGKEEDGKKLVQAIPGYDLLVVAGGYGEPTYQPEQIDGSDTKMIVTGNKGMYAGLVGLYERGALRYARVPLTHEFEDAPEMRQVMKEYQDQLKDIGLDGLGLLPPIPHSSGQKFIGTQKCAACHTDAYDVWESTPHALATDHIVEPPQERGDVPRHFDPECVSCHVTGWNPQEYYPYLSGYLSLEQSQHLTGSGCENCHGPGSDHAAAEVEGADVSEERREQLRDAMKLPLAKAREKCMTCHDLDNSPDFHEEGAFEDIYWPEVEH